MFCLAYASVPLYSLFCKVTGYGGTTQTAKALPKTIGNRKITILFNSDIEPKLNWEFKPLQRGMQVTTGESRLAFYYAKNLNKKTITGTATYNVTPNKAGIYFNKIECFCFTEQSLNANEEATFPVSFFIDPEIENDPYMSDVDTITLSYTFFEKPVTNTISSK